MFPLIKKDLQINDLLSYSFIALLLIASYLVMLPPVFLFIVSFTSLLITLFYYDDKRKVNKTIISMPISKVTIIQARYLYLAGFSIILLLFQSVVMVLSDPLINNALYMYDWRDLIVIFCIALLIIAICIPIFVLFQSILMSIAVISL